MTSRFNQLKGNINLELILTCSPTWANEGLKEIVGAIILR